MDDTQFFDSPPTRRSKRSKKWIVLVIFLILLVGIGVVAAKFLTKASAPVSSKTTPTPTDYIFPTDTPAPSGKLTPSPSVSGTPAPSGKVSISPSATPTKSSATITVENGSGTAGVANKMATFLKGLGYTVVSTTNADNFNYTNVTIEVKKSESSILPKLKSDISANYSVGSATATLPESSSTDAVVIIGQ